MLTRMNKLIGLILVFISINVLATEVVKFNRIVTALTDYSTTDRVMLISQSGQVSWLKQLKIESERTYKMTNLACLPKSQNTVDMGGSAKGMTLAYPFLVGTNQVCYIDEANNSIRLLTLFDKKLIADTFSVSYAGEDENSSYFLMNARQFPDAAEGYMLLVSIHKITLAVSVRKFITSVPGFSAAMLSNGATLWVTSWLEKNDVYKISISQLISQIQKNNLVSFASLAVKSFGGFEGTSSFMVKNDLGFMYFNQGAESYVIEPQKSIKSIFKLACEPIMGIKNQWLQLCDGNRIELLP